MGTERVVRDALARAGVRPGIGWMDGIGLSPSQPHHRLGLAVLRRHPWLSVVVAYQALLAGVLALDICRVVFQVDGGRGVLLDGMGEWLLAVGRSHLSAKERLVCLLIAAGPFLFVLNIGWTIFCGVICGRRPTMGWLLAGFPGLLPLRLIAWRWMPKWLFFGGEGKTQIALHARLLQFSWVYRVVNRLGRVDVENAWARAFDRRLRDITDSYFSYVMIPIMVSAGIGVVVVGILWFLQKVFGIHVHGYLHGGGLSLAKVVVVLVVWGAINRAMLGMSTFAWLSNLDLDVPQGSAGRRFVGFAVATLVGVVAVYGIAGT